MPVGSCFDKRPDFEWHHAEPCRAESALSFSSIPGWLLSCEMSPAFLIKSVGLGLLAVARLSSAELAEPSDLAVDMSVPGEVNLAWTAANLRPYQLEGTMDLLTWAKVGVPVVGSGAPVSMVDGPVSAARKFYRLRVGAVRPGFDRYSTQRNDDESSGLVPIGFPISLFGRTETHCFINNNGNITFDRQLIDWTPNPLQNLGFTIIAPFWADVDTRPAKSDVVRYSYSSETVDGHPAFGVNWMNVGYYSSRDDKLNSFQLILIERSDTGAGNYDMEFNYNQVLWETGDVSGGVNGYGGSPSRSGLTNGIDRTVELAGSSSPTIQLDANPATGQPNFLTGLIYRSRNSNIPGRYMFQVRGGSVLGALAVNAGPNQTLGQGSTIVLDGSASDPGGGAVTVRWSVRKASGVVTFSDPDILNPTVIVPTIGVTELMLTATSVSDPNVSASDIVQIK